MVSMLKRRVGFQRDMDRIDRQTCMNIMKFSKVRCKILHLSHGDPKHEYRLGDEWTENCPITKDLVVLEVGKLSASQ